MKYLLILLMLFLVGCGHTPEKIVVTEYVLVDVVCPDYAGVEGIKPLPVVFVEGNTEDGYKVLGLRGDMYSNLSINSAEVMRYIKEQKLAISYYRKCIEDHNSTTLNEEGEPE